MLFEKNLMPPFQVIGRALNCGVFEKNVSSVKISDLNSGLKYSCSLL